MNDVFAIRFLQYNHKRRILPWPLARHLRCYYRKRKRSCYWKVKDHIVNRSRFTDVDENFHGSEKQKVYRK